MAAGTLKKLLVSLGVESGPFDKGMDAAEKKTKHLEGTFDNLSKVGMGITAGIAVGIGAGAVALASTVAPATDLAESINAVNVVFEEGSEEILAYGENAAISVGLSNRAFGQMSAEMGAMLGNVGVAEEELAGETINLMERASDMASVFNTDADQAFGAIQSAIKGEFNPLEQFGVKMNQAMINAKAMEMGLADATGEISDAAKAQAALALVYDQTDKYAGVFQNTSDGLATSQRQLAAIMEDTKAAVGAGLTPALETIAGVIKDIAASPEFAEFLEGMIAGVTRLGDYLGEKVPIWIDNFRTFTGWLSENKGVVVGVLAAMGVAVLAFGISVATAAWAALVPMLPVIAIMLAVAGIAYLVYEAWTNNWGGIQEKMAAAKDFLVGVFQTLKDKVVAIWTALMTVLQPIFDAFKAAFEGDWYTFGEKLREAWDNFWELIKTGLSNAFEKIKTAVTEFLPKIKTWFTDIDWGQVGLNIIKGIANGITNAVSWIKTAAKNAAKAAFDAAKGFLGIHSPSTLFSGIGENMMLGMAGGIGDFASVPVGVTQDVTSNIATTAGNQGDPALAGAINNMSSGQGIDYVKLTRMLRDAVLQGID